MKRVLPLALLVPVVAFAEGRDVFPLVGDPPHGAQLFRLSCAGCHGAHGVGDGLLAAKLAPSPGPARGGEVGLAWSDADLFKSIHEGGASLGKSAAMPAFSTFTDLDVWDLVAYLRQGQPTVLQFFPGTGRYLAKTYTIDDPGKDRLKQALGSIPSAATRGIQVATVFTGEREPGRHPVLEAQDPVTLDSLKPRDKLGYVVFVSAQLPGDARPFPVGLGIDVQGKIVHAISSGAPDDAAREKLLQPYVGQGARGPFKSLRPAPVKPAKKGKKPAPAPAAGGAMDTAYAVAMEAVTMYDKEERDRTWADAPAK